VILDEFFVDSVCAMLITGVLSIAPRYPLPGAIGVEPVDLGTAGLVIAAKKMRSPLGA